MKQLRSNHNLYRDTHGAGVDSLLNPPDPSINKFIQEVKKCQTN